MVEEQIQPRISTVRSAVLGKLYERANDARYADDKKKIAAGSHRFDIFPSQAIFRQPQGFLIDREQDAKERAARNAAAIVLWENRCVDVTEDGLIVRDCEPYERKRKLKLVNSNGR